MKKLLILSVSAGAGHVRAAQAVQEIAEIKKVRTVHIDVMEIVPKLFRKVYAESYIEVVEKYPELWGYLYNRSDKNVTSKYRNLMQMVERMNTRKLFKIIEGENPDCILCTHFLPPQLLSRKIEKGKFDIPVWVQVTDFDIHRLWVHDNMSGYFTASDEISWRLKDRGIDESLIHTTGIPISTAFQKRLSMRNILKDLGLVKSKTTLLLMAGGAGVGDMFSLCQSILSMKLDLQIIALAGKNKELLAQLKELQNEHLELLAPLGFTKEIEKYMQVSDFAVTKPGGLTSSECLAMGLPMIIVSPIPGQEERNSDYLLENGAALKAYDTAGLQFKIKQLVESPDLIKIMSDNAKRIGKPKAALKVLNQMLKAK